MEISKEQSRPEIVLLTDTGASHQLPLRYKNRFFVGSSQTCDVMLNYASISPIHAVIELKNGIFSIYDMNSHHGTFVNGERINHRTFKVGDYLSFGRQRFLIQRRQDLPPQLPVLEMLDETPSQIIEHYPKYQQTNFVKKLPTTPEQVVPKIVYPLTKDPKADFTEYIFEDVEVLYPIFKYDPSKSAVEIIILFQELICSVDYLPAKDGVYYVAGARPAEGDVEYAYLGPQEKQQFIEVRGHEIFVSPLYGHEFFSIADQNGKKRPESSASIYLGDTDIFRFKREEVQIFVRRTEAPPRVDAAPLLRRDPQLKQLLVVMLLLVCGLSFTLANWTIDKKEEEEKIPERVATILYKKKLVVPKSTPRPVEITETKPKEEIQKAPPVPPVPKKEEVKPIPKVEVAQTTKKPEPPKKVEPKQAPKEVIKPQVTNNTTNHNQQKQKATPSKNPNPANPDTASKNSVVKANSQGHVDTYKAVDFSSTVNSLLAKGGATSSAKTAQGSSSAIGGSAFAQGGAASATATRANLSKEIGSLTGSAQGKLDAAEGVEGLVDKKGIYTAGVPFQTVVLGGMDPDIIRKILIEHIPQFRYCYQKSLDQSASEFHGKVRLNFIIGASGHVTNASVQSATTGLSVEVQQCVVNVLTGIVFPEPRGGGRVEVKQPFNFYPKIR